MGKYILKNGKIYWHRLYFDLMPRWSKEYGPPLGSYNYAYYFYQPHQYIVDLYYRAKWFVQRGIRGYADCDAWDIDGYLTGWMPEALRVLQDNKIGHPWGMTQKGWEMRLARMIDGFIAAQEITDLKYDHKSKEQRMAWRRFNTGMKLFHKHYFSLWD